MKIIAVLLLASFTAFAADTKPATDTKLGLPRYDPIMSEEGKLLATLDTKEMKVEYIAKPEAVVDLLILKYRQLGANCQAAVQKCEGEKKPWWRVW